MHHSAGCMVDQCILDIKPFECIIIMRRPFKNCILGLGHRAKFFCMDFAYHDLQQAVNAIFLCFLEAAQTANLKTAFLSAGLFMVLMACNQEKHSFCTIISRRFWKKALVVPLTLKHCFKYIIG